MCVTAESPVRFGWILRGSVDSPVRSATRAKPAWSLSVPRSVSDSNSVSPVLCEASLERRDDVDVAFLSARERSDGLSTESVSPKLARGRERDRDRRLAVEEDDAEGLVGVTDGDPERKRFFISSIASSVGLRGVLAVL